MAQKQDLTRKKKKQWFTIIAPKEFKEQVLAETPALDIQEIKGRKLRINVMTLLGDPKKQNFAITFRVTSVEGTKGITQAISYTMQNAYIKRVARKDCNKIDHVGIYELKDAKLKLKTLLITKNKTHNSVLAKIRKETTKFLTEELKEMQSDKMFSTAISGSIQKSLREKLKKTYPIVVCDFRMIERVVD
ncbi:hypothetical protein J4430_01130 [Candidatus Woesearchaeota archaeon]|nr:hypothetical protein [Candidatus Woesearchaeota archaeon]